MKYELGLFLAGFVVVTSICVQLFQPRTKAINKELSSFIIFHQCSLTFSLHIEKFWEKRSICLSYGLLPAACSLDPVKKEKAQQPVQRTWAHYVSLYWSVHLYCHRRSSHSCRHRSCCCIIFVYIDVVLDFQSADVGFPLVMTPFIRDDSKQMWLWFPRVHKHVIDFPNHTFVVHLDLRWY